MKQTGLTSSLFPYRNVDPDLRERHKTWEEETGDDEWFKKEEEYRDLNK